MPQSIADLLANAESILDVQTNREQLRSGRTRLEDVEEMAPHTPWRDFLTETLLDPSQYLTGGVMGAGFAAKLGKPVLATALKWADPLLGGSEAIGRALSEAPGKWPVGARMSGFVKPRPGPMMGTTVPRREFPQLIEGYLPRELPAVSPQGVLRTGTKTIADILPLGAFRRNPLVPSQVDVGLLTEGGPQKLLSVGEPQKLLSSGHGELSEDVVNLSNSFTRQFRQPIDELVEAADKVVSRNRLVRDAEKLLGKKPETVLEKGKFIQGSPTETKSELVLKNDQLRARLAKDLSMTELKNIATERGISPRNFTKQELKQYILKNLERQEGYERLSTPSGKIFTQGDPTEKFKVGDFIEFTDKRGKVIKGKIRDIDEVGGTAEVFTDRAKVENPDRASEEVFLERIRE